MLRTEDSGATVQAGTEGDGRISVHQYMDRAHVNVVFGIG